MGNIILISTVATCLWTDLKERRIYNKVLLPALILGILINISSNGIEGLKSSIIGFVIGLLVLMIPFILGGVGGGDVKLLGIIGAIKGPQFIFYTFLATGLSGGIIAIVILIYRRGLLKAIKNIYIGFKLMLMSRFKVVSFEGNDEMYMFPYGVAISIGTLVAFVILGG